MFCSFGCCSSIGFERNIWLKKWYNDDNFRYYSDGTEENETENRKLVPLA